MKLYIKIVIMLFLAGIVFSTIVNAGDPLENDSQFLWTDPDDDGLLTGYELLIGSDPYNSDSDNDGLDDFWEDQNYMDPTDSSDAHLDNDYYPANDFTVGENAAEFKAIHTWDNGRRDMTWPGTDIVFTDVVFNENSMHYDNYEEYYRPVMNEQGKIKILKTDPNDPNSDDDHLLDPDDVEPLKYNPAGTIDGNNEYADENDNTANNNQNILEDFLIIQDHYNKFEVINFNFGSTGSDFDFGFEQITSNQNQLAPIKERNIILPDAENDGI